MDRICIIGAGPSGLAAAKNLASAGVEFDCLEKEDELGGVWNIATAHGRVHETTRMVSSKGLTEFLGFRMPRDYPHFPDHSQALRYLASYADHFKLRPHIRFGHEVVRVERDSNDWLVWTARESEPRRYSGIVVANGHHCRPRWPNWRGEFGGEQMHAASYKFRKQLFGKRVLVVGGGNTACDIAVEAAEHASYSAMSLRRGYHIFPKFMFGAPIDRCGQTMHGWGLPDWIDRWITRACLHVAVGSMQPYGWPQPDHEVYESHPIINSKLIDVLGHRKLHVYPEIESVEGTEVIFADGKRESFDTIVCATGYITEFPFFPDDVLTPERLDRMFLHMFHPEWDNLFVIGLIQPQGSIWQLADYQSRLLARYLVARKQGNGDWFDRQKKKNAKERRRYAQHSIATPRHDIEVDFFKYRETLDRYANKFSHAAGNGDLSFRAE